MKYYFQAPVNQLGDENQSSAESEDSIVRDKEMFHESSTDYQPEDESSESDDDMQGHRTPKKDLTKK